MHALAIDKFCVVSPLADIMFSSDSTSIVRSQGAGYAIQTEAFRKPQHARHSPVGHGRDYAGGICSPGHSLLLAPHPLIQIRNPEVPAFTPTDGFDLSVAGLLPERFWLHPDKSCGLDRIQERLEFDNRETGWSGILSRA